MTPFIVCQSKDRVYAVPRSTTRWFRQNDVLAVLRRSVDELLGIHCGKKSKSVIPVKVIVYFVLPILSDERIFCERTAILCKHTTAQTLHETTVQYTWIEKYILKADRPTIVSYLLSLLFLINVHLELLRILVISSNTTSTVFVHVALYRRVNVSSLFIRTGLQCPHDGTHNSTAIPLVCYRTSHGSSLPHNDTYFT